MADDTTARCYGHVFDPAHRGEAHHPGHDGWPAHQWGDSGEGSCLQCPDPVAPGDRYVCVNGGILHARCIAALDAAVLDGEADRG